MATQQMILIFIEKMPTVWQVYKCIVKTIEEFMVRHKMNDLDIYIMKWENTWNMISFILAKQILFYGNTLVT